ncbi:hypothetical protein [Caldinitratiruptor microaerophilus]|uniref:Uncharacterized protein n=1 Tax=Caldinitratiruptor microaerophilus TaxID=671077 RepID=A0AA35G807_9FIRM|nr:hypothetical protein [Caldinitratiruptor microaerophilus]BDG59913.1 hypothetical protein caldi_10030 [Caldinitratiruptor microaerophilus]
MRYTNPLDEAMKRARQRLAVEAARQDGDDPILQQEWNRAQRERDFTTLAQLKVAQQQAAPRPEDELHWRPPGSGPKNFDQAFRGGRARLEKALQEEHEAYVKRIEQENAERRASLKRDEARIRQHREAARKAWEAANSGARTAGSSLRQDDPFERSAAEATAEAWRAVYGDR